jgi:hypothetical protein
MKLIEERQKYEGRRQKAEGVKIRGFKPISLRRPPN